MGGLALSVVNNSEQNNEEEEALRDAAVIYTCGRLDVAWPWTPIGVERWLRNVAHFDMSDKSEATGGQPTTNRAPVRFANLRAMVADLLDDEPTRAIVTWAVCNRHYREITRIDGRDEETIDRIYKDALMSMAAALNYMPS